MDDFPGVVFRDGPAGRRAGLAGGPDVWEIVRAVRSARAAEPTLKEGDLVDLVAANAGLSTRQVRLAVGYWAAYPDEVDALLAHAEAAEAEHVAAWERAQGLLAR